MRTSTALLSGLICAGTAFGQTAIDLRTQAKSVDFSAALATKPSKSGTVLPATCSAGETFLHLSAQAGQNVYVCTSSNTWTAQGQPFGGATPEQVRAILGLGTAALKAVDGSGPTVPTTEGVFAPNAVLIRDPDGNLIDSGCTITVGGGIGCPGGGQITVNESAAPAAPATGSQTLFFDSADHAFKLQTSSGVLKQVATTTGVETLVNKTLTAPAVADFTNASHNHAGAVGGGQLGEAAIALTDTATGNATTARHGFLPKLSGNASDVLKGDGTFGAGATGGGGGFDPLDTTTLTVNDPMCYGGGAPPYGAYGWGKSGTIDWLQESFCGITVATGASANAVASLFLTASRNWGVLRNSTFDSRFKFTTPASLAQTHLRIGFKNAVDDSDDYFIGLSYYNSSGCTLNNVSDSGWVYRTAVANSYNSAAGPAIAPNTDYTLRIRSTAAGTLLFSLSTNGGAFSAEQAISNAANIPGTLGTPPIFQVVTCEGVAKKLAAKTFRFQATGLAR